MQTDYVVLMHIFGGTPGYMDLDRASALRSFAASWLPGAALRRAMEDYPFERGDMHDAVTSRYPGFDGTAPDGRSDPAYREASSMALFAGFVLSHRVTCPDAGARQGVLRAIAREGAALLDAVPAPAPMVPLGNGAIERAALVSGLAWLDDHIARGPSNTDYAVLMAADQVRQGRGIWWDPNKASVAHAFGTWWMYPLATAHVIADLKDMPVVRAAVAARYPDFDEMARGGFYDPAFEEPLSMAVFVDFVTVHDAERLGPSLHHALLRAIAREGEATLAAVPASAPTVPFGQGAIDRAGLASGLAWLRGRIAEGEAVNRGSSR